MYQVLSLLFGRGLGTRLSVRKLLTEECLALYSTVKNLYIIEDEMSKVMSHYSESACESSNNHFEASDKESDKDSSSSRSYS